MPTASATGYASGSQIARRVSEAWGAVNLYCAACDNDAIDATPANTKAIDFVCPRCSAGYQLKAGRHWNARRVPDGAYGTMIKAVEGDCVPNLLVMQYTPAWTVHNLMLIPSFVFNASAIERRKPLSANARRAGWTGCNILLSAVPESGKLCIVDAGSIAATSTIRAGYQRLRPLAEVPPTIRGWALDVLRVLQTLERPHFLLSDVYAFEERLSVLHPENQNVRAKIRQQLQVLRDLGLITFTGNGRYLLVA